MSFGVSDKEIAATIEKMEGGRIVQSLLLSKESAYINHFNSIFEELWDKGVDAADGIRDIEGGTDLADLEIIQNPREGIERAWRYVKKSELEVLSIFSTVLSENCISPYLCFEFVTCGCTNGRFGSWPRRVLLCHQRH